jgi:asparagine synthase (glutamine-hydrolysing)
LAGYTNYRGIRLAGGIRSGDRTAVMDAARSLIAAGGPYRSALGYSILGSRRLPPRLIRGRLPQSWFGGALPSGRRDSDPPGEEPGTLLARKLWADVSRDNLPGLLRYEDRNSMAFGIEARVPFLDHRLVEAALALPDRLKIDARGRRKVALHRAMRGIVPDMVLARRDKVAFQPPQERWLRESRDVWLGLAGDSRAERDDLLAPDTMRNALGAFEAGHIPSDAFWRVVNLELWLRSAAGHA